MTDLIDLLEIIAIKVKIEPVYFMNRDPKDNFLLDLINFSNANYVITEDKDLLEHHTFKTTKSLCRQISKASLINN